MGEEKNARQEIGRGGMLLQLKTALEGTRTE